MRLPGTAQEPPGAPVERPQPQPADTGRRSPTMGLRDRLGHERAGALSVAWQALWASRLLVWIVGLVAILKTGFYPGVVSPPEIAPFDHLGNLLVGPFARWDSFWYLSIAQHGYHAAGTPAFFPLYPMLAWTGGWLTGSPLLAGLIVSLGALLVALYLISRLVSLELGERYARPAVLVCAFFPMALFYSAAYTESLFLALTVGAVYAGRLERWALAGALGALAAATRNTGVLVALPLLVIYLYGPRGAGMPGAAMSWRNGRDWRARLHPRHRLSANILWLALVPAGLAAYLLYTAVSLGDALAPFHATQTHWHRQFHLLGGVLRGARSAWHGMRAIVEGSGQPLPAPVAGGELADPVRLGVVQVVDFSFLIYALVASVGVLRRLPAAYGAYSLAGLAVAVSAPVGVEPLASLPRYVVAVFPLQIWLAAWALDRRRLAVVLGASALALGAFESQFATWRWVA